MPVNCRIFSASVRRRARCESCGAALPTGGIFAPVTPFEIGGRASFANCEVLCRICYALKMDGLRPDAGALGLRRAHDKAQRAADFHAGVTGPGLGPSPLPGGRRTTITRTFRHGVQPRRSMAEKHALALARHGGGHA